MSDKGKVYVRLKPYNRPKGFMCRRFVYRGAMFKAGEWRMVSRAVAADLLKKIQPNSEDAPKPLFDVAATLAEAEAMDAAEIPATRAVGAREVTDIRKKPRELRERTATMIQPDAADEPAPDDLTDDEVAPAKKPRARGRK